MLKTAAGYHRKINPQISHKIPAVAQHREIHATNISHICRPVRTAHPTRPSSKIIPYGKRSPYFRTSLLHTKNQPSTTNPHYIPEPVGCVIRTDSFFRCKRHAKNCCRLLPGNTPTNIQQNTGCRLLPGNTHHKHLIHMPTGAHGTPYKPELQNNSLQKTKPLLPVKPITHQKSTIYHKPTLYPGTRRVRHTHRLFSFAASDMLKTAAGYHREIHATNISHIRRPVRTAHPTSPASKIIPYKKRSPYFRTSLLHTKKSSIYNKPALYSGTRRVRHTHRLFFRCKRHAKNCRRLPPENKPTNIP